MARPIVAIVGRPNVGKSTLFNKLSGERVSIVENTPGVTRDRLYHDAEWNGRSFVIIDTGGIEPTNGDMMLSHMRMQAQIAIESADVIIFMTDVSTGVTADDKDIATILRKSGKPCVVCVNKVDKVGYLPPEYYEFFELAMDDVIAVSSLHGTGSGDLLDRVVELMPPYVEGEENDDGGIKVAVIGKPNAGKSSLINCLLGENRVIVSDVAGTTRDAIDTFVHNEYGDFTFIDTAGIRRSSKIDSAVEKYSVLRAHMAVERADVCLIMIDGNEGLTEQDEHIAGIAHEAGKASIVCVNKWDAVEKDTNTVNRYKEKIYTGLSYMTYAPIAFISAKTGQRVNTLYEKICAVHAQNSTRITTGMLNDVLADAVTKVQPPTDKGKRLKVYYMTQVSIKPPTFVIFCNSAELFHYSYQRYIENQLRAVFGFEGTPIKLIIRERSDGTSDTK